MYTEQDYSIVVKTDDILVRKLEVKKKYVIMNIPPN